MSEKQLLFPLFSENSQNRYAFLNTAFGLSNSVNKVSSMPSLFSLNDSVVHSNDSVVYSNDSVVYSNDSSEDLLRRKLQALIDDLHSIPEKD